MRIHECPFCSEKVKIKKVECTKCGLGFEGEFYTSPVMSLSEAEQSFIELFVLSSGSLKEMAHKLGVSYPTVRARLDEIIETLAQELEAREQYKKEVLERVEKKELSAEEAAEIIKNI